MVAIKNYINSAMHVERIEMKEDIIEIIKSNSVDMGDSYSVIDIETLADEIMEYFSKEKVLINAKT